MATHSSVLAWRIPWTEEPGGPQSTGSQQVEHEWSDWAHMRMPSSVRPQHLINTVTTRLRVCYVHLLLSTVCFFIVDIMTACVCISHTYHRPCFVLSRFSRVWLLATLPGCAPSTGFSRQRHWSGLPFPPPGDLPNPGIKPTSLTPAALADRFFPTSATWETLPQQPARKYLEKENCINDGASRGWWGGVTVSNGLFYQVIL